MLAIYSGWVLYHNRWLLHVIGNYLDFDNLEMLVGT